jgi:hypothetical protein
MRNNRINLAWFLLVFLLAGILVPVAQAGKFHFNSIDFSLGGSLLMEGHLVGLGNEVAEVTLSGYGSVVALCENNGGKQAPGRNPIQVGVQETGIFVSDSNGRALVAVIAPDPTAPEFAPSPTPKEAGCPNGNWSVVGIIDGSTNWTAASVVVKDEDGQVRVELMFACTTFFEDGIAIGVECEEV